MATLDFSPDANPATPPEGWLAVTGSSPVAITGGNFDLGSTGTQAMWVENTALSPTGKARVTTKMGQMNEDSRGGGFLTVGGNGYLYLVRAADIRVFVNNGGTSLGSAIAPTITRATVLGEEISMERDMATGVMEIYSGTTLLGSYTSNVYTSNLLGAVHSRGGLVDQLTVTQLSSTPTLNSVNSGNGVRNGSTGNSATFSAGFTPTSGNIGGRAVTNIAGTSPTFTFDLAEAADEATVPYYGSVTASFTNGVNTPTLAVPYLPKTGYSYVTLAGTLDTTIDGVLYEFDPVAFAGNQIAYPSPPLTIGATGVGESTEDGTFQLEHIVDVGGTITLKTFNLLIGETPVVEPGVAARLRSLLKRELKGSLKGHL